MPASSVPDTMAREVNPPPSPMKVRPPVPTEEACPPSAPVEVCPLSAPVQEATGTESPISSCWADLVEADEATDGADALEASSADIPFWADLHPEQVRALDIIRPRWLDGEEAIGHMAGSLVHDHGMEYSEAEMRHALAWMVLQRRDMALHLHLWLLHRTGPDHEPRRVLEDLLNHLLSIEIV